MHYGDTSGIAIQITIRATGTLSSSSSPQPNPSSKKCIPIAEFPILPNNHPSYEDPPISEIAQCTLVLLRPSQRCNGFSASLFQYDSALHLHDVRLNMDIQSPVRDCIPTHKTAFRFSDQSTSSLTQVGHRRSRILCQ